MRFRILALVVVIVILVSAASARADSITPALSFDGITLSYHMDGFDAGWAFTANSSLSVTALGFLDVSAFGIGGSGIASPLTVTIWTETGTLLSSAVLAGGTAGTLIDGFRYTNLDSALRLDPGNYVIGSHFGGAGGGPPIVVDTATVVTNPLITYHGGMECCYPSTGLGFPDQPTGAAGDFGPNMLITALPVQDTLTLLVIGMAGFVILSRTAARPKKGAR